MDMSAPPAVSTVFAQQLRLPDSLCMNSMASDYEIAKFVLVSCKVCACQLCVEENDFK